MSGILTKIKIEFKTRSGLIISHRFPNSFPHTRPIAQYIMTSSVAELHRIVRKFVGTHGVQGFRYQKEGQRRQTIATTLRFINIISGSDPTALYEAIHDRIYRHNKNNELVVSRASLLKIYRNLMKINNASSGHEKKNKSFAS